MADPPPTPRDRYRAALAGTGSGKTHAAAYEVPGGRLFGTPAHKAYWAARVLLARLGLWLALRYWQGPVLGVSGIERLVISHPEPSGPAHVTLRVRLRWTWLGRTGESRQTLHARLGAEPSIEDESTSEAV